MREMDLDKDLWHRIVNVAYRVKIAINMFAYVNDCIWHNRKFLEEVKEEINLIKGEVKKLQNRRFYDAVVHQSGMSSGVILPYVDNNKSVTDDVVGFKNDISWIIADLLKGTELQIVAIVGMAGQGKTTLAKKVSRRHFLQNHFVIRAWCHVSRKFESKKVLLEILNNFSDRYTGNMEEDDLKKHLHKSLKGQRYLIVLDDVWDEQVLRVMSHLFPDDDNGSRILLTTRNRDAVHGMPYGVPKSVYTLCPLTHAESLDLLRRRLFQSCDFPNPAFVELGNQIARNCNGLPLAIVVTADLLLEKVDNVDWWEKMAESLDSQIANRGGMDSVELSYKHLPEFLKPCFLYFGAFQADKVIRARRLIQLWVSEGFIRKYDEKSLEDVAIEYLQELVSRSLVVVTSRSSTGGIKTCRIDGLFFEFCLAKGKEEKFLQVESGDDLSFKSRGIIYKNYRICIQSGGDGFFASNPSGPCVHSLLFVPDYTSLNKGELFSIPNFKLLHILDMEDMEFNGYFPEEVTLLVLLRYLALWCPSGIISIPPSIANLRNLETFLVKRQFRIGNEISLPNTLWEMKRLRNVDVDRFTASFSRASEPDEDALALDNIQKFSTPCFSCGEDVEKLLTRLTKVRKLRCQFSDSYDSHQSGLPTFGVLNRLESLNVRYLGSDLYRPRAFNLPSTLKKLTLAGCRIPWSEMSRIVNDLHNLEVLKLHKDAFIGKEWDVTDYDFIRLKFLKLSELDIARWIADSDCFPSLEQLLVESCYALENIPSEFGKIESIKRIQVRWCKPTVAYSVYEIKDLCYNDDMEMEIY